MRVLVLTADLPPHVRSGIGRSVGYQVAALAGLGCKTDVATTVHGASLPSVRVTQLSTGRFPQALRGSDVLHLHSLRLAELAWQLKKRDGSSLLYTAHSLLERELACTPEAAAWIRVQERLLQQADHVIFLSEGERRYALKTWPCLRGRSSVLPHGIPVAPLEPCSFSGPPIILFAGRFCRSKGIDVAIAIMRTLLRNDSSATVVLAGGQGDAASERLVSELVSDYPARCLAPGWLSQNALNDWLRRTTVLLVPSRYEPFGMIALEAQAKGVPVLGARVDGMADLLGKMSGGATVADHDAEHWAEVLERMLADRAGLASMSERGPRYVHAEFGLAAHAERYLRLLRSCVPQRDKGTVVPSSETFWQAEDLTPCG
jgi:glycosyltransferase involved in cell wall biosynthesis